MSVSNAHKRCERSIREPGQKRESLRRAEALESPAPAEAGDKALIGKPSAQVTPCPAAGWPSFCPIPCLHPIRSDRRGQTLRSTARWLALAILVIAGLALFGWKFGRPTFVYLIPGSAAMKVNAAIAFFFSGTALLCLIREQHEAACDALGAEKLGKSCGVAMAPIRAAACSWNTDWGQSPQHRDHIFFHRTPRRTGERFRWGRMSDLAGILFSSVSAPRSGDFSAEVRIAAGRRAGFWRSASDAHRGSGSSVWIYSGRSR